MERQHSRRRRSARTQEPALAQPVASRQSPRPLLTWSLIACLLVALTYFSRPLTHLPWTSRIAPLPGRPQRDPAAEGRPRMALHPEDHVSRPPATQHLDWRITSAPRRPDGVLKQVYLINDLFPGPTIEARSGDSLLITVTNAVEGDSIALHWHGIHVASAMDGAAGVSQCPILPGGQFVYNVTIPADQSGTFWYHAHSGVSRGDGLYGGLVVHAPTAKSTVRGLLSPGRGDAQRFNYQKELLLLIGDWYHRPAKDVLAWYKLPGSFANEPVPDSMLVNGVGHFDCAMAVPARPVDCIEQLANTSFLDLDPDTAYRIRVVNTGALAGLSLVFGQNHIDLIQVDSVDVKRSQQEDVNSAGILYPGQRMDFVLHASPQHEPSTMMVQLDQGCFKYMNPALTPDQTFPIHYRSASISSEAQVSAPTVRNHINVENVPSSPSILMNLPPRAQQTHVVYTKIQKMARNHNIPEGYFNQTTWKPQNDPPTPLIGLPRVRWDSNQLALSTGSEAAWVDLVVNNLDEGPHPFHLHGHHFYILTVQQASYGWGSYDPFSDPYPPGQEPDMENESETPEAIDPNFQPYDLSRAALRDTVQIPSRGYAVLRFRADNPGVWLFHCHILWHLATGMAMLVDVMGDPTGQVAHDNSTAASGLCPV
ncbi:multicopper oxidase-domain-containing protein [Penicillium canariense]|uniref:Multicopper oxidase-domain-containing protein n=1 Tax=Penicillium canariense TaxID=189055 RepID=A0A9W9I5C5_9EURO|nr:multicopper oxidase-domain-containing protein [Penicillium canariense]KAJ5167326.1 multicopper oxidase-domain-containing protein [Penicillium canariense]